MLQVTTDQFMNYLLKKNYQFIDYSFLPEIKETTIRENISQKKEKVLIHWRRIADIHAMYSVKPLANKQMINENRIINI